jgi:adenylate cyclase
MVRPAQQPSKSEFAEQRDGNSSKSISSIPSADEIKHQVVRILSSPEFEVPDRARKFLQYLVDETLAGRADRIKAYSIAIEVFGRDDSFDAQNDPVVRIEAGRIRRALERYYLVAGQADPVILSIPKGGYVPLFERRDRERPNDEGSEVTAPTPKDIGRYGRLLEAAIFAIAVLSVAIIIMLLATPKQPDSIAGIYAPKVAVASFSDLGEGGPSKDYAFGLTAEIINQLARFKDIVVIAEGPPDTERGIAGEHANQFALTGSVRASRDRIRVTVQLIKEDSKEVLWAEAYEDDLRVEDMLELQKDVAQKVATAIGQPYGVVFRADSSRIGERPPDDLAAYSCTLAYFAYRAELRPQRHAEVRECLERAIARFPRYATAWALLSLTYIDEDRFEYNPAPGAPTALARALDAARQATSLDPNNVRALQALMLASFFNQDVGSGIATGKRALALNPNDMELLGEFGVRTALSGDWANGAAMIERALAQNPSNSNYYYTNLALAAYMQRDFVRATDLIAKAKVEVNGLYCLIAAAIYGQMGMNGEARLAEEAYFATHTHYLENLEAEMTKRNLRKVDQALFVQGLRKAGLPVPHDVVIDE